MTDVALFRDAYDPLRMRSHLVMSPDHSYSGNSLAVLDRFERHGVLDANRERTAWLDDALTTLRADPRLAHWRQRGMIWAFDVPEALACPRFAERMHLAGRRHELLIRPIGRTVYLMPPYVLDAAMAHWLAGHLQATLADVLHETPSLTDGSHADRAPQPAIA